MRRTLTYVLCASALLMGATACSDDETISSDGPSSTTTSAPADEAPMNIGDVSGELVPGTYFIDPDGDASTPLTVIYEVAAEDWETWIGASKITDEDNGPHTMLSITTVTNLVRDGCLDHEPLGPAVGPTVDDLATALSELAPFEVTAPPSDVTLFGYQGKHVELTIPQGGVTGCEDGELHSWISPSDGSAFFGYNGGEPGLREEFWILDVDGTRLVLVYNTSPDAPAEWQAERQAIVDSIQIQP